MFDNSLLEVEDSFDAPSSVLVGPMQMICVCCNCDRVRLRVGVWSSDHTPVAGERRTHGICPDCFVILYPEFAIPAGR